jgi:hypothetical protein
MKIESSETSPCLKYTAYQKYLYKFYWQDYNILIRRNFPAANIHQLSPLTTCTHQYNLHDEAHGLFYTTRNAIQCSTNRASSAFCAPCPPKRIIMTRFFFVSFRVPWIKIVRGVRFAWCIRSDTAEFNGGSV